MLETDVQVDRRGFLDAVQTVLQRNSAASEADLIIAAACHHLMDAPCKLEDIQIAVQRIWPNFPIAPGELKTALDISVDIGLTVFDDERQTWVLTAAGLTDLQQHGEWVSALRERAMSEIRTRARQGLGVEADADEAGLWLDTLVEALFPAIEKALHDHIGSAKSLIEGKVTSHSSTTPLALEKLSDASPRTEVVQLLQSLAVSALDPLDPFGLELVTHIATGCVLNSYMTGASSRRLNQTLGTAKAQRAILDTPVLLTLIGSARDQKDTELTIRKAVDEGWDVVVGQHSLEELYELVERELPNLQRAYQEAYARNAQMQFYASLVDDQFHGLVIASLQDNTYKSLTDVREAAASLGQRLEDLGVNVRPHGNEMYNDRRDTCRAALTKHLEGQGKQRSPRVIQRDADTMTMAWRRRRRETSQHWPGAWIITTDQAIGPAYSSISNDAVSLTLTLSQWTTIIAISADTSELVELASAAAGQFVDEAVWHLPVRYPADFAIKLAAQLSPAQGGSNLDLHHAQAIYELPEMLDKIASSSSASNLAAEVLAERTRRLNSLNALDRSQRNKAIASAYVEASSAQERELDATRKLQQIEDERRRLQIELESSQALNASANNKLEMESKRRRRILISGALLIVLIVFFILTLVFGGGLLKILSGAALAGMSLLTYQWCMDLEKKLPMLISTVILEILGAVSAIFSFLPKN